MCEKCACVCVRVCVCVGGCNTYGIKDTNGPYLIYTIDTFCYAKCVKMFILWMVGMVTSCDVYKSHQDISIQPGIVWSIAKL